MVEKVEKVQSWLLNNVPSRFRTMMNVTTQVFKVPDRPSLHETYNQERYENDSDGEFEQMLLSTEYKDGDDDEDKDEDIDITTNKRKHGNVKGKGKGKGKGKCKGKKMEREKEKEKEKDDSEYSYSSCSSSTSSLSSSSSCCSSAITSSSVTPPPPHRRCPSSHVIEYRSNHLPVSNPSLQQQQEQQLLYPRSIISESFEKKLGSCEQKIRSIESILMSNIKGGIEKVISWICDPAIRRFPSLVHVAFLPRNGPGGNSADLNLQLSLLGDELNKKESIVFVDVTMNGNPNFILQDISEQLGFGCNVIKTFSDLDKQWHHRVIKKKTEIVTGSRSGSSMTKTTTTTTTNKISKETLVIMLREIRSSRDRNSTFVTLLRQINLLFHRREQFFIRNGETWHDHIIANGSIDKYLSEIVLVVDVPSQIVNVRDWIVGYNLISDIISYQCFEIVDVNKVLSDIISEITGDWNRFASKLKLYQQTSTFDQSDLASNFITAIGPNVLFNAVDSFNNCHRSLCDFIYEIRIAMLHKLRTDHLDDYSKLSTFLADQYKISKATTKNSEQMDVIVDVVGADPPVNVTPNSNSLIEHMFSIKHCDQQQQYQQQQYDTFNSDSETWEMNSFEKLIIKEVLLASPIDNQLPFMDDKIVAWILNYQLILSLLHVTCNISIDRLIFGLSEYQQKQSDMLFYRDQSIFSLIWNNCNGHKLRDNLELLQMWVNNSTEFVQVLSSTLNSKTNSLVIEIENNILQVTKLSHTIKDLISLQNKRNEQTTTISSTSTSSSTADKLRSDFHGRFSHNTTRTPTPMPTPPTAVTVTVISPIPLLLSPPTPLLPNTVDASNCSTSTSPVNRQAAMGCVKSGRRKKSWAKSDPGPLPLQLSPSLVIEDPLDTMIYRLQDQVKHTFIETMILLLCSFDGFESKLCCNDRIVIDASVGRSYAKDIITNFESFDDIESQTKETVTGTPEKQSKSRTSLKKKFLEFLNLSKLQKTKEIKLDSINSRIAVLCLQMNIVKKGTISFI